MLRGCLLQYDLSGSGMIPKADFAKYVQDDALSLGIRPSQATILARTADLNKDGFIDFAEFAQMVCIGWMTPVSLGLA